LINFCETFIAIIYSYNYLVTAPIPAIASRANPFIDEKL
jgi:hypothetical protein